MRYTRSGAEFSPYRPYTRSVAKAALKAASLAAEDGAHVVKATECDLAALLQEAFAVDAGREDNDADDAEGNELEYTPSGSPVSSPDASPDTSPVLCPAELPDMGEKLDAEDGATPLSASSAAVAVEVGCPSNVVGGKQLNHGKRGFYTRRKKARLLKKNTAKDPAKFKIRSSLSKKHQSLNEVKTSFGIAKLTWAKGAWVGVRQAIDPTVPTLEELREEGFEVFEWDGVYVPVFYVPLAFTNQTQNAYRPHIEAR